jgi:hypothetical protein
MKRAGSNDIDGAVSKDEDDTKRQRLSTQQSEISQASSATVMPDDQSEPDKDQSRLMEIYATSSVADDLQDPTKITRLRLRDATSFHDEYTYGTFPFREFEIFALLPTLTHITLNNIGGIHIEDSGSYARIPAWASGVKHISMRRCQLSTGCLTKIMGFSNKCLESFTYRTGALESPDTSGAPVAPGPVWAVLGESSATLKKLDIDFDSQLSHGVYWDDSEDDGWGDSEDSGEDSKEDMVENVVRAAKERWDAGSKGPEFSNLIVLRIGIEALMTLMLQQEGESVRLVDVLPRGLEELVIRGYDANAVDSSWKGQIDELVERKATKLPSLTVLKGVDELIPNGKDLEQEEADQLREAQDNKDENEAEDLSSD